VNHSAGVIPEGEFIKRINFVISERESNGKGVQDAITKLGGQDNINTPVWWDKP
jgi:hypothetical protein